MNRNMPPEIYKHYISSLLSFRIFSLLITVVFQMMFLREIERYIGWYAMAIVYLGSGISGSLASAIFLPYHVEVSGVIIYST